MQLIKYLIGIFLSIGFITQCLADPPFQILQSCINGEPYNNEITLSRIDGPGRASKSLYGCENQYGGIVNEKAFGTLWCNDEFYLILNDQKVNPRLAKNRSVNPNVKPGLEFTIRSLWYKIVYKKQSYLCILAPLSENGYAASYSQYYIVKNAFNDKEKPELYFYFLDVVVAPHQEPSC